VIPVPSGAIPVRDATTREVLYGARSTSFRFELLAHNPATGVESFAGLLDGVQLDGSLSWVSGAGVKKSGALSVVDLLEAGPGLTRIADVDLLRTRIRPVMVVEGLPEFPLGAYLVTAAPESWSGTGRTFALELHDKCTVLDQDAVEVSFTASATVPVLTVLSGLVESAGERITVDGQDVRTLTAPLVWEAGTSKLRIVNDLLAALNFNSLTIDALGNFQATPYVRPADRSIRYTMLNNVEGDALVRELSDGAESIYSPEWARDRDAYGVPNKVIAVAVGSGGEAPLSGTVSNTDASSPFSIVARGRTIVRVVSGVDVPDFTGSPDPAAATVAFLTARASEVLISSSSVQAGVSVKCLPIPVDLLEAVVFAHAPAGIDARHTVRRVSLALSFAGLMQLDLVEVQSL
jgi:hypothetical protein